MCGIAGILLGKNSRYPKSLLKATINNLFLLSELRGREASGIAALTGNNIIVYKKSLPASRLIQCSGYKQMIDGLFDAELMFLATKTTALILHTRLATNGSQWDNNNNSPIIVGNMVGVHNGIIVNADTLRSNFPLRQKKGSGDSETLFSLLDFFNNANESLSECLRNTYREIIGAASIAVFVANLFKMILASNTGSLYLCENGSADTYMFASELPTLEKLIKKLHLKSVLGKFSLEQLKPGSGLLIDLNDLTKQKIIFS